MVAPAFVQYAKDALELIGATALYLTSERGEYLCGSVMSVNWDVETMEAQDGRIVGDKLLRMTWVGVLPLGGGRVFSGRGKGRWVVGAGMRSRRCRLGSRSRQKSH